MLGWLLVAVALAALFLDPGLWGMVVVAGIVLVYLIVRSRSWNGVHADAEVREALPDDAEEDEDDGGVAAADDGRAQM